MYSSAKLKNAAEPPLASRLPLARPGLCQPRICLRENRCGIQFSRPVSSCITGREPAPMAAPTPCGPSRIPRGFVFSAGAPSPEQPTSMRHGCTPAEWPSRRRCRSTARALRPWCRRTNSRQRRCRAGTRSARRIHHHSRRCTHPRAHPCSLRRRRRCNPRSRSPRGRGWCLRARRTRRPRAMRDCTASHRSTSLRVRSWSRRFRFPMNRTHPSSPNLTSSSSTNLTPGRRASPIRPWEAPRSIRATVRAQR